MCYNIPASNSVSEMQLVLPEVLPNRYGDDGWADDGRSTKWEHDDGHPTYDLSCHEWECDDAWYDDAWSQDAWCSRNAWLSFQHGYPHASDDGYDATAAATATASWAYVHAR